MTLLQDCVWVFTTTPGHRIKLVFNEFEMEPHQVLIETDVILDLWHLYSR